MKLSKFGKIVYGIYLPIILLATVGLFFLNKPTSIIFFCVNVAVNLFIFLSEHSLERKIRKNNERVAEYAKEKNLIVKRVSVEDYQHLMNYGGIILDDNKTIISKDDLKTIW